MRTSDARGPAGNDPRSRGALLVSALAFGLPLLLYVFILTERKYPTLFDRGAFLQTPLTWWEKTLFPVLFAGQILVLFLTATAILRWLIHRMTGRSGWTMAAGALVALVGFPTVTVQFEVYGYFKDGIDLAMARSLAGGGLGDVLAFVEDELAGLWPAVLGALAVVTAGAFTLKRHGSRIAERLGRMPRTSALATPKGLLLANVFLVLAPAPVLAFADPLEGALNRSLAHQIYKLPIALATDFDGDGYGLINRPFDRAPFDGGRFPYAVDIPGNGIDEDGIGGDLPKAEWRGPMGPWDHSRLTRRSVLLVVLESARGDLLDAEVDGSPVMPNLVSLPGPRVRMMAHLGFTGPGLNAILKGTLTPDEEGASLFDRFWELGCRTGVFSGQPEDFEGIAKSTGMDRADVRWDASRLPAAMRMYPGARLSSLTMPGRLVFGKLEAWMKELDARERFFAYVNLQEMHFPYNSDSIPRTLVDQPLPRAEIVSENRDRLVRTYWNAAREADTVLGMIVDLLRRQGRFDDTLLLVVGDHGEELYDRGSLGHGISINYEQNMTFLKVVNSRAPLTPGPVGLRDVHRIVYNALVRDPAHAVRLDDTVLALLGGPRAPRQIGVFSDGLLRKYDFKRDRWTREAGRGAREEPMPEDPDVIHLWESFQVHRKSAR